MGCCGGPTPNKSYKFKEYIIPTVIIVAIVLYIYFLKY